MKPENGYSLELGKSQADFEEFVHPSLNQGEDDIRLLEDSLGIKPRYLKEKFDAPSIWSTIGLLSSETHSVSNLVNFELGKELKRSHDIAVTEACTLQGKVHRDLYTRIDKISKYLLNQTNTIQNQSGRNDRARSRNRSKAPDNVTRSEDPESYVSSSS